MYGNKQKLSNGEVVWVVMPERVLRHRDKWIEQVNTQEWAEMQARLQPCNEAVLSKAEYEKLASTQGRQPKPKAQPRPQTTPKQGTAQSAPATKRKAASSLDVSKGGQVAVQVLGRWQKAPIKGVVAAESNGGVTKVLLDYSHLPPCERNESDEWLMVTSERLQCISKLEGLQQSDEANRGRGKRRALGDQTNVGS